VLGKQSVINYLQQPHDRYVLVPTDKASNNIAVVCKYFYVKSMLKEVGLLDAKQQTAYNLSLDTAPDVVTTHLAMMKQVNIQVEAKQSQLPLLLWIPKMHKTPSKQRFIAASHSCTTKPVSAMITKCLKLVQQAHKFYCNRINSYTGFNFMWIIVIRSKFTSYSTVQKEEIVNLGTLLHTISQHCTHPSPMIN
jgi:hypothetical protein